MGQAYAGQSMDFPTTSRWSGRSASRQVTSLPRCLGHGRTRVRCGYGASSRPGWSGSQPKACSMCRSRCAPHFISSRSSPRRSRIVPIRWSHSARSTPWTRSARPSEHSWRAMRDDDRCARAWQVFVDGIPPGTDRRDAIALSVMIVIPSVFAARTITRDGDAGRAWIDRLPGVVAAYLERWDLTPDGPVMHGYVAIVLPVVRHGDGRALLALAVLDGGDFWE